MDLVTNTNLISKPLVLAALKGYAKGKKSVKLPGRKFGKDDLISIDWNAQDIHALNNFRSEAFHVAGVGSYDLEEELKELAIKYKDDFGGFEENARRKMLEYGIGLEDQTPTGWLKTNLYTAVKQSYSAAEWQKLQDPVLKRVYPAYRYMTVGDNRVRPEHAALHGKIYGADDPIWESIMPQNSWNCRCYIETLDREEAAQENYQPTTGAERKQIIEAGKITKEFNRNAGMTKSIWGKWLQEKLADKKYEIITERMKNTADKMPEPEEVIKQLEDNAAKFRELEYTSENWAKDFPDGKAKTPLGEFNFGDDFFNKLERRDRENFIGLVKPTLENPEYIIVDKDKKGEYGTLFLKAFIKDKTIIYSGVLKEIDNNSIIISYHRKDNVKNKVRTGKLLVYSLKRGAGTSIGKQKFTRHAGGANFEANISNKVERDYANFRILNLLEEEVEICQKPDEVWAELIYSPEPRVSEANIIYYIKYRLSGFECVIITNGSRTDNIFEFYGEINNYRKGMLIYNNER